MYQSWKFRIVAGGHNIRDLYNAKVMEDVVQYVPASFPGVRYGMAHEGLHSNSASYHGDKRSAYLSTPLGGKAKFLRLPTSFMGRIPRNKRHIRFSYARIRRAMYGFNRSGADFSARVEKKLRSMGWIKVRDVVQGMFYRGKVISIVYCDDMIVSGPKILAFKYFTEIHHELGFSEKSYSSPALMHYVGILGRTKELTEQVHVFS